MEVRKIFATIQFTNNKNIHVLFRSEVLPIGNLLEATYIAIIRTYTVHEERERESNSRRKASTSGGVPRGESHPGRGPRQRRRAVRLSFAY